MAKSVNRQIYDLIKENNFGVVFKKEHDPKSGWTGEHIYVYNGEDLVTDLSGNGFCFAAKWMPDCLKEIKTYIKEKNIDDMKVFKKLLEDLSRGED